MGVVAKATLKRGIVIEPISVPKELSDRCYTGEAVAQQLIDEINATYSEAENWESRIARQFLMTKSPPWRGQTKKMCTIKKKLPSTAETHADRTGGSDFFVR